MKRMFCVLLTVLALTIPSIKAASVDIGYYSGPLSLEIETPLWASTWEMGIQIINTDTNEIVADAFTMGQYFNPAYYTEGVSGTGSSGYNLVTWDLEGLPAGNYKVTANGQGSVWNGTNWYNMSDEIQIYFW